MPGPYVVLLVKSTSHAVRAEHLLDRAGIATKLIPVPRTLSSECGVCLRLAREDLLRALEALQRDKAEPESVHDL